MTTDKELQIAKQTNDLLENLCELYGVNRKRLYRILSDFFDAKAKELEDFDYSMKESLSKLEEMI